MRHRRLTLFVAISLANGALHAGLRESSVAVMQPAQELLQKAALDPTPGSLALMILVLGVLPFSMIVPMTAGSVLAGALLPARVAPFVILAGMLLNTVLAWSIARTVFGRRIEAWIERRGGALGHLRAAAKRSPFKWSFFSRFIPAPFSMAPMVLASAGVSLGQVVGATALVMTPWSFAYAWAGRESREGSLGSLALAGLGIVVISSLTLWAYRRFVVPAEAKDSRNPAPKPSVLSKGRSKSGPRSRKAKA